MTSFIEQRRQWAYALIARCKTPVPKYGSPEWLALPNGPEKVASCVIAAESWALDGDNLTERLSAELEAERAAFKAAEDADYVARRDGHRADWTDRGFRSDPRIADAIDREWREWVGGDVA